MRQDRGATENQLQRPGNQVLPIAETVSSSEFGFHFDWRPFLSFCTRHLLVPCFCRSSMRDTAAPSSLRYRRHPPRCVRLFKVRVHQASLITMSKKSTFANSFSPSNYSFTSKEQEQPDSDKVKHLQDKICIILAGVLAQCPALVYLNLRDKCCDIGVLISKMAGHTCVCVCTRARCTHVFTPTPSFSLICVISYITPFTVCMK